jgi:16S rRNA processing protein RimM
VGTLRKIAIPEGLLEVGHIGRAHGIRGDVFLVLTTDRDERAAVGSKLWARDRWFTVTQSSNASGKWRVHLEGVDDRNAAEALTGTTVFAEPIDDADALWVHDLIGATVLEKNGIDRGTCVSVVSNPAADLLELESGALVPVTFVTDIDVSGGVPLVTIDPPDGLFDLKD